MTADLAIADIKAQLVERLDELVATLCPEGTAGRGYWSCKNPTRADRTAGSMWVWLSGAKAGGWTDAATGDKGDVIDLIAYVNGGGAPTPPSRDERVAAIKWAKDWLGLGPLSRAEVEKLRQARVAKQSAARAAEAKKALEKQERARALFGKGEAIAGSVAERYLRARGIELPAIPTLEHSLRFLPDFRHWEQEARFPAMIAAFTDAERRIMGVHVTWLRADGTAKAPVAKPKMMFGTVEGLSIRLAAGAAGQELVTQGISEGIENGLTVAMALPELMVDAAGSVGNIGKQTPRPGTDRFLVLGDNDLKAEGQEALARAVVALQRLKPTAVAQARGAKDFNDQLRGV